MLTFNKETHTYTYDGKVIPSVTQILKGVGLIDDTFYNNDAAKRGTYIHKVLEVADRNPNKQVAYNDGVRGYVESWERFKRENNLSFTGIEEMKCNAAHLFAGTIDRRFTHHDMHGVLDIKTGIPARWHSLQTAAYSILCGGVNLRCIVYLRNDGTYNMHWHDSSVDEQIFFSALMLYRWIKEGK